MLRTNNALAKVDRCRIRMLDKDRRASYVAPNLPRIVIVLFLRANLYRQRLFVDITRTIDNGIHIIAASVILESVVSLIRAIQRQVVLYRESGICIRACLGDRLCICTRVLLIL